MAKHNCIQTKLFSSALLFGSLFLKQFDKLWGRRNEEREVTTRRAKSLQPHLLAKRAKVDVIHLCTFRFHGSFILMFHTTYLQNYLMNFNETLLAFLHFCKLNWASPKTSTKCVKVRVAVVLFRFIKLQIDFRTKTN